MFLEKEAIDYFRRYDFILPVFSGSHGDIPARIIGRNMEFEQYNNYAPGDSIRDIDWKIYGRTDRLFIKKYGSDLSSRVRLVLDNSQSMSYLDKFDLSLKTVAIFFYLLQNFHSKVELFSINHVLQNWGRLSLPQLESLLEKQETAGMLDLSRLIPDPKSITFFFTDLWTPEHSIDHLIRNKINVVHIMHPRERDLDISGNVEFIDMESRQKLEIIPSTVREEYRKRMHLRLESLAQRFRQAGLLYGIIDGQEKYYIQLKHYLSHISHQKRVRNK